MKLSNEMKQMLDENIVYLATSTQEGKPNVVPIGLIHAISDEEVLIGDVLFNKTKKNLEENQLVAISFTDIRRLESYQLKGKAKIYKSGKFFDIGLEIMEKKKQKRRESIKQVDDPKINERASKLSEMHRRLKLKAVVLITVEEIYSHIPKFKGHE
ncbi:MAG: pyridoxamine 5'-phosphate oxidase family protein [Methanosarcinales archaeon]|nr:pyridoxamine 5'-phosphate oxidase family protein [Methanosarcinales archaeon]